jgi:hypothetical protein
MIRLRLLRTAARRLHAGRHDGTSPDCPTAGRSTPHGPPPRWWPWRRRHDADPMVWSPPDRIPGGDSVPVPGWPRHRDAEHLRQALGEPTQILPTVPLLTRAGWWRATGGRWSR